MSKPIDYREAARNLFDAAKILDGGHWTNDGSLAVLPHDDTVKFCAIGAIVHARTGLTDEVDITNYLTEEATLNAALEVAIFELGNELVAEVNRSHSKKLPHPIGGEFYDSYPNSGIVAAINDSGEHNGNTAHCRMIADCMRRAAERLLTKANQANQG